MQELNTGRQNNFRFEIEPASVHPTQNISHEPISSSQQFLIRPEGVKQRHQAIEQFELESNRQQEKTTQAKSARPGVATLLLNAEILLKAGEKTAASHLLRQVLALDSNHPEGMQKMIRCLGDQDWELSQKRQLAKALVYVQPNFENYFQYAQFLLQQGELDLALENFFEANMRVTEENESLFEVFKQMGNIFVRKGDFESAEEFYNKAFTLNPDSDVLQVNLGTLAVQKQDWSEAMNRFRRSLELNSINDKAWVGLGLCYQKLGDAHMAQAALENALDIDPSNRTAVHLLASWSFANDQVAAASERLKDYLATQESDVEMSLVLIHLFCHLKNYRFARLELERAICWSPDRQDLVDLALQIEKQGA